jgi:hypothetical protein
MGIIKFKNLNEAIIGYNKKVVLLRENIQFYTTWSMVVC